MNIVFSVIVIIFDIIIVLEDVFPYHSQNSHLVSLKSIQTRKCFQAILPNFVDIKISMYLLLLWYRYGPVGERLR